MNCHRQESNTIGRNGGEGIRRAIGKEVGETVKVLLEERIRT
jgi:hypothetical protein